MDERFTLWRPGTEVPELVPYPTTPEVLWSGWCWLVTQEWEGSWPGYFELSPINKLRSGGLWHSMEVYFEVGEITAWVPAFVPEPMRRTEW